MGTARDGRTTAWRDVRWRRVGYVVILAGALVGWLGSPLFDAGRRTAVPSPATATITPSARDLLTRRNEPTAAITTGRPPVIYQACAEPEACRAEVALAKFVTALQMRRYAVAAALLASTVPAPTRSRLRRGEWLLPETRYDPAHLLYHPAIRLRTEVLSPTHAIIRVSPEVTEDPVPGTVGIIRVRMLREGTTWRVDLREEDVTLAQR